MTGRDASLAAGMPHGKARAHTRFVRVLRIVLPLAMVGVVVLLAALVIQHAVRRQAAAHQDFMTPIRMTNPHFYGRDNQGRAFTIGARDAQRDESSLQVVLLEAPTFTLDAGGAHPSTLTADSGVYHEDTRMLLLQGHVQGDDPVKGRFATNQMLINTKTGSVVGGAPLAASGGAGAVNAQSYEVKNKGETVIFKGGVHARLKSH